MNGRTTGRRISSRYLWAFTAWLRTTKSVWRLEVTPAHTRTLPPPHRSRSMTQQSGKSSPRRRKTCFLPSAMLTLNLDSSENKALAHWFPVHLKCCLAHWRRCAWCLNVRIRPLNGRRVWICLSLRRRRTVSGWILRLKKSKMNLTTLKI